ncbi:MAG TPA: RHS repeat-associated core domain-containing protein, partial [Ktedonobacteraceae bacterium]|nr:RHS repeat-associated core domain-containing protein [Ktedonobacteraceae bacterium]
PKAYPGQVIKSFTPGYDPLDGAEWMLIMLEKQALFFLDGEFLFSEPCNPSTYPLVLLWGPGEANIAGDHVFLFSDPIVELQHTDGLDRVIQIVHLDQHAEGTIASQILYDGWGHPAVTTKPLYLPEISLAYQQDLVKTFDWNSGKMTGKVVDYYREAILGYYREGHAFVSDQKLDDGQYPYSRQIAEANPLARISQVTQPGVDFQADSPLAVRIAYGRTPEANALLADLNLTDKAEHYALVTTYRPFEDHTRSVTAQLFDLQGTLVALRRGSESTSQISTRQIAYASDGTRTIVSTQPNAYPSSRDQPPNQYKTTATIDFQGHIQTSTDCDSHTQQAIYDQAGRLCFKLDAEGAMQSPQRILYWHYDSLGRVLEEGIVRQEWKREQLQHYADVSSPGEAPGGATWTRRYVYDMSANMTTTNLKGRLCEVRTRDEDMKEVREAFEYDLAGKLVSTHLTVEAFDTQTRVTRNEYDRHGNVTRIIYPYDLSGNPGFEVHYFYNTNGQLASIGTADDPGRYATYDYDLEGRIKTEHLNNRRFQRNHSYSIQGRLLALQDGQGIFSEELSYRDANGNFKDGSVVGATIAGFATPAHNRHAYSYQYDEYGRLTAAQTKTAGYGIVPHPAWDVQGPDGPIEYDANGNLLDIKQGQAASMYRYEPGTNQLALLLRDSASLQPFGFEADELDHFHTRSTAPMQPGDWYSEPTSAEPITTTEKHSGAQSHQLGVRLFSPIAVTPDVSAYSFTGWIKNDEEDLEVEVTIQNDLIGPILARQTIGNTNGQWKQFECMIEDAGHTKWLFACIAPKSPGIIPAVYIDDVSFGPLEQETYQHNQNGWVTKTGKLDALQHDPHTALPVDIRNSHQRTHFRYGGRGQRVLKTTIIRREIESPQRLYIHGGNAYPLTEITQDIDLTGEQPPRRGMEILYIYGPGGIVAMCEDGQTTSFLLKDHLGSLRVALNEENQPIATFHYLPFGSLLPDNGDSPEATRRFRYLYTGQEYDEEIGLYNYRARLYDSDLGRFLTPDPKRQFPSPYVYVNNNPLSFTDPTGEMFLRVLREGPRLARVGGRRFASTNIRVFKTAEDAELFKTWRKTSPASGKERKYVGLSRPLVENGPGSFEEVLDLNRVNDHMNGNRQLLADASSLTSDFNTALRNGSQGVHVFDVPESNNPLFRAISNEVTHNVQAETTVSHLPTDYHVATLEDEALNVFRKNQEKADLAWRRKFLNF